jgi:hypothetical protein
MRRYLIAALVAEVIAFITIFQYCEIFGAHTRALHLDRSSLLKPYVIHFEEMRFLTGRAYDLALQLDLLDNAAAFLIIPPAITVLGMWTLDRRRKQKSA